MSDDLVDDLREACEDAVAEIVRLRAEIVRLVAVRAENERLRAALGRATQECNRGGGHQDYQPHDFMFREAREDQQ